MTHLLSVLCILMTILSRAGAKNKTKMRKGFRFSNFIGLLSSDIMAVKGLGLILTQGAQQRFSNNDNEKKGRNSSLLSVE